VLFVFIVLSHDRRRIVHLNVTSHPTAAWTAQQLREAWLWDRVPRFVIRDRDPIYGLEFRRAVLAMGVEEVLTAPRSPWQNPFVERVIGSLRRECLDHVIVWNERALRRHLQEYLVYYHEWRTHLSLDQDAPVPRAVHPPTGGSIRQVPHLGGGITITNGAPPDRRVPHHEPLGRHSPALARVSPNQPAPVSDMSPPRGLGSRRLISVRLIGRSREGLAGGRSYW
jgi:hypothetical protein